MKNTYPGELEPFFNRGPLTFVQPCPMGVTPLAACCVPMLTQPSTLRGTVKWVSAFGQSNNIMAIVDVGHDAAYIQANSTSKSVGLVGGSAAARRADLHSSRWTGWTLVVTIGNDDSTINIVFPLFIIIIIIIIKNFPWGQSYCIFVTGLPSLWRSNYGRPAACRRSLKVGFHCPSSRPEFTGRVDGPWTRVHFWRPSTRAVNSGSGNRP